MALKKCNDCKKKISELVVSCPNCGSPRPFKENITTSNSSKKKHISNRSIKTIVMGVICLIFIALSFSYSSYFKKNKPIKMYSSNQASNNEVFKLDYNTPSYTKDYTSDVAEIKNFKSEFIELTDNNLGGLNYKIKYLVENKTKRPIIVDVSHNYLGIKKYSDLKNHFTEHSSDKMTFSNISSKFYLGGYPSNVIKKHYLNPLEKKEFTIHGSVSFTSSTIIYDKEYYVKSKRSGKEVAFRFLASIASETNLMGSGYELKTKYELKKTNYSIKESYFSLNKKVQNKFGVNLAGYIVSDSYVREEFKNSNTLDEKYIVISKLSSEKQNNLKKELIESLLSDATKEEDIERFSVYEKEFRKLYIDITTKAVIDHYYIYNKIDSIEAYKFFIKHFSNYDIATVAIHDMHEKGYILARGIDTKEGYDSYLSLFPYSNKNNEVSILANEHEKKEIESELNLDSNWLRSIFTGEEDKRNKREVISRKLFISAKKNEKNSNIHVANRKYFIIINYFNDTEAAYRVIDDQERKVTSKLEKERFSVISDKLVSLSTEIKNQTSKLVRKLDTTIDVLKNNREAIINAMSNNSAYITEKINLTGDILTKQLTHMELMKEQTKYLYDAKEEQDILREKRLEKVLKNR